MGCNTCAWKDTVLGFWPILLEQHSSGWRLLGRHLEIQRRVEESDGDGFLLCLIRQRSFSNSGCDGHGCSPCLSWLPPCHLQSYPLGPFGRDLVSWKTVLFCYKFSIRCFFGRVFVSWKIIWLTGPWSNLSCTCNVKRRNISTSFCFETPRFGSFGRVFLWFLPAKQARFSYFKMARRPLHLFLYFVPNLFSMKSLQKQENLINFHKENFNNFGIIKFQYEVYIV